MLNGYQINAADEAWAEVIYKLSAGELSEEGFREWLQENVIAI